MVHQETQHGSVIKITKPMIFTFVAGAICGVALGVYFNNQAIKPSDSQISATSDNPISEETGQNNSEPQTPPVIDLQPTVDSWATALNSSVEVGVEIYDLDNNQIIAQKNPDKIFPTESLYKLFVVYEGYRRLEQGVEDANTIITDKYTYEKCLDLAIRESHSPCAEALEAKIGNRTLEGIIKNDYKLQNSSNLSLTSTASDIADMMKIYYEHKDLTEESWRKIQDSMLNQPVTTSDACDGSCDWRQGLPSGFKHSNIYNKVGWRGDGLSWISYHDSAIAEIPIASSDSVNNPASGQNNTHHYIIVVMTSRASHRDLAKLGSMIEEKVTNN